MKHIFIINPAAGKKNNVEKVYAMAERLRRDHELDVQCMLTKSRGHATVLARGLASDGGAVRLYACGGDGTINEVANGIAGLANAAMTAIPIGTGNDFLKNFGREMLPKFSDAEQLWNGDVQMLDLIRCNDRLCLTIACNGIDARIAESVHDLGTSPMLNGRGSYLASIAVNFLFRGIAQHWTVSVDGDEAEGDFSLVSMCNGRYYGGGSTPVPQARMNDGVLHAVLVKAVDRIRFAKMFPAYSAGNYDRLPPELIRVVAAKEVRIRAEDEIVTCVDGECFRSHDVTMGLSEKKLQFFGPAGCDPNATAR